MAAVNSLDLDSDERSIIGVREFDAPRELVFSAWTSSEHLAQWWGPNGFSTTTSSFDFRPGGIWRFVMHGPDGRDYQNRVTFDEIVRPDRIVYRHGSGDDVEPVQFKQTVIFQDIGGRTRVTWRSDFSSAAERTRVIKEYGADKGRVECMARLGEHVQRSRQRSDDAGVKWEVAMPRVCVGAFSLSLDGFGAGLDQSLQNPIGMNGMELHAWAFKTRTFRKMHDQEGGETGIDDQFAARSFENVGAWVLGRNMFGPVRGPWPDESWKGWWGTNPPYHVPVFVLTHYARSPIVMEGGTTFYFVTDGVEAALRQAREAAQGRDVRIGGGVSTIQQYLRARLIDEMHLAVAPVFLGSGESLFAGLDLRALGYACTERVLTPNAIHLIAKRQDQ